MGNMDGWDVALLVAAGYVAVTALVRLMIRRRNQAVAEFRKQLAQERQRRKVERLRRPSEREQVA